MKEVDLSLTSPSELTGLVPVVEGEGGWSNCWFKSQQFDSPLPAGATGSPREYLVVSSTGWQLADAERQLYGCGPAFG